MFIFHGQKSRQTLQIEVKLNAWLKIELSVKVCAFIGVKQTERDRKRVCVCLNMRSERKEIKGKNT